jgi:hypothetical protein
VSACGAGGRDGGNCYSHCGSCRSRRRRRRRCCCCCCYEQGALVDGSRRFDGVMRKRSIRAPVRQAPAYTYVRTHAREAHKRFDRPQPPPVTCGPSGGKWGLAALPGGFLSQLRSLRTTHVVATPDGLSGSTSGSVDPPPSRERQHGSILIGRRVVEYPGNRRML